MRPRPALVLYLLAAAGGLLFAATSTYDFVQHLDRQVHGLHCSFLPGVGGTDVSGASGCHVALMSPYSSVLRDRIWGGIPISLPAMAVFAFLLYLGLRVAFEARQDDRRATRLLLLGALVPVAASAVMGSIAILELHALCKLCVGIYTASALLLVSALALQRRASWSATAEPPPPARWATPGRAILAMAGFVLLAVAPYVLLAPDFERYVGACGELAHPDDPHGVLLDPWTDDAGPLAVEVFDPLCPSCRALEERLAASGLARRMDRRLLLFPLDDACNWMVGRALHPGACTVSEALICADGRFDEVLAWAFANQDAVREAEEARRGAAREMVEAAFPELGRCLRSRTTRARLNRGLRWAVRNRLQVLTPQLFVDGRKVCDEDTDLGLEFALGRLLARPVAQGDPP